MPVSEQKYRKVQKALQFLRDNSDAAKEEMGQEGFDKYVGSFEGIIGKYESEKAQDIVKRGGGFPITDEWQKGARKERDEIVTGGTAPQPPKPPPKAPPTGEAAVQKTVEEAAGEPPKTSELEGAAVPLGQLIAEREKAEELRGQQYDESLPTASKLKELNVPPEHIGEGPVNHQSMWFEPTIDEFHEDMKEVLGDQVLRYDEKSDAYKEYSDQRWKEAYEKAKGEGRTLMRVDFSPSTTGGVLDWKNRLAHAQDALYAGVAGVDRGLLLGAGAALSGSVTPGAKEQIERTEARHPIASGLGLAGGILNPQAVSNLAARGVVATGRALAPGTAKLLGRMPILGGIVSGAAQGAAGAGAQVAGEELVEQAAGTRPPDPLGALRRGGEAAAIGGAIGAPLGGMLGGAARLQERVRRGKMGTDIRRAEAPDVGGKTTVLGGFRAGKPIRDVRERAIKAGRPVSEGGEGVYPAPSAEGQLAGEVAEDVRRFGAARTGEFREAEAGLTEDLRGLAERRFADYQNRLEQAAEEVTGFAQERTRRYATREAEAGQFAGDYALRTLGELERAERELTEELVAYGTEASREYDGLLDQLTQTTLKGARKFTEEQKREAGDIVGRYYRSTEGKRTRDTKPIIKAFDDALQRMTDARGIPLVNRRAATEDVQSQARLLFNESTIRVVDSAQEAEALARKISRSNATRQRGEFGDAEVLTVPQARRFGLRFDEAANIGDEKAARIVVERRRLDAKGLDAYLYGYRDWANANSAKGIKHRETSGVERSIHRAREQSPGFTDVKERAAELASTAERRQKAVGVRGERVGREDIDTERSVRGVLERAREGVPPNPELENILVREEATAPMAQAKRLKTEAGDVGLELPRPEGVSQQEIEALRGRLRRAVTEENPSIERVLAQRGRLRGFRGLQAGRERMRRLGVSEDIRDVDIGGRRMVEKYSAGEPNPQLEGIAHEEGWLQGLRELPAIREEMAALGLKPSVGDVPTQEVERHIRATLAQFADDALSEPTAERLRAVLGSRGFNQALLPLMKKNFAELGIPERVGEKFTPKQAAVVKKILSDYSKGTLPEAQREALTRGLWMSRTGAPKDLDRLPQLRQELADVGLKPDVGTELTPEQIAKVRGILQRYAGGAPNQRLEQAVGEGLPRLRLLPGLRSTERLEEAGRPHLRASQSSLWASVPTLGPLILRGDAALRHLRKIRPSAAAAGEAGRRKEKKGGKVSETGKQKLKKLRLDLDPSLRRL
jgi:hypothetical protein